MAQSSEPLESRLWEMEEILEYPALAASLARASLRGSGTVERQVAFGPHPQQQALLYLPGESTARRNTLIYFVHGGGWRTYGPRYFRFVGRFFARRGYPVLLGGYRLAPEHHYPDQMEDVYRGFTTGMNLASDLGLQAGKIVLGGQSAGGQLTAMALLDREEAARHDLPLEHVSGFFSISGPLDYSACPNPSLQQMISDFTGSPENRARTDPVLLIRGDETTPALLIHGGRDGLVALEAALNFASRYNQSGRPLAHVHIIPSAHHADLAELFIRRSLDTQVLLNWIEARDRAG